MKILSFFLLIVIPGMSHASGFQESIQWIYELPDTSGNSASQSPTRVCAAGTRGEVLYVRPYDIGQLNWSGLTISSGFRRWGLIGSFSHYGVNDIYGENRFSGGVAFKLQDQLAFMVRAEYRREDYVVFGVFNSANANIRLDYFQNRFLLSGALEEIRIVEDYRTDLGFRPCACGTYMYNEEISFSAGLKRFPNSRYRWLLDQRTRISAYAELTLGIIGNPNQIFGRLIISHGHIALDLTYYSVDRLDDMVVLGLSFGSKP